MKKKKATRNKSNLRETQLPTKFIDPSSSDGLTDAEIKKYTVEAKKLYNNILKIREQAEAIYGTSIPEFSGWTIGVHYLAKPKNGKFIVMYQISHMRVYDELVKLFGTSKIEPIEYFTRRFHIGRYVILTY